MGTVPHNYLKKRKRAALFPLILGVIIVFCALSATFAQGYLKSEYIGGWPGICENGTCFDDGTPQSAQIPDIRRNILQHNLESPTCATDLIYINIEYPENTGSPDLDAMLATTMAKKFREARDMAQKISCNDFFEGCAGKCLPVGIETKHFLQKSAPFTLSLFRVDRFIGNYRKNVHVRGTVSYNFANYDLRTGKALTIDQIFPKPQESSLLFWEYIDGILAADGNCPAKELMLEPKRPAGGALTAGDLLLSSEGATIALWSNNTAKCQSRAIDIPAAKMVAFGALEDLWAR
ncbi:MAG: hypothetical protein LBE38_08750 [Deltaproteobacteria bacterium]|jgi:hypothetical protein|nr:hypothetical protein [Deltaproteobacteria bacterium]